MPRMGPRVVPLETQLLAGRQVTPEGCWLWKFGCASNGYGKLMHNYKTINAHRAAAIVWMDLEKAPEMYVLHRASCKNRNCFNPAHLYLGTQKDNVQDELRAGTHHEAKKTHCPRGHAYSGDNLMRYKNHRYCKTCAQQRRKNVRGSNSITA